MAAGLAAVSQHQLQDLGEDNSMIRSNETNAVYDIVESPQAESGTCDVTFPGRVPQETVVLLGGEFR